MVMSRFNAVFKLAADFLARFDVVPCEMTVALGYGMKATVFGSLNFKPMPESHF